MGKSSWLILIIVFMSGLMMSGMIGAPFSSIPQPYQAAVPATPTPVQGVPIAHNVTYETGRSKGMMQIAYFPFVTLAQNQFPTPGPTTVPTLQPTNEPTQIPATLIPTPTNIPPSPTRNPDPSPTPIAPTPVPPQIGRVPPQFFGPGTCPLFTDMTIDSQCTCPVQAMMWCWDDPNSSIGYDCSYTDFYFTPAENYRRLGPDYPRPVTSYGCVDKPILYLYPETPTYVDVEVVTSGKVIVSDPHYPEGGWKNVLAHPDGTLLYQGRTYRELFYESKVPDLKAPKNGIIIPTLLLEPLLDKYVTQLGLIGYEKKEFMKYWVARLKKLNSPYILFSLLDKEEKARTDTLLINPKPDTFIEFIAYFKPLKEKIDIEPLILPKTPPQRVGFTAVEWGGTVDEK